MKTLRQKLLVSLVVAFMVCASMFCALSFQTAKADVNADLFTIEEGASVAIQKDGLRFRVVMGANVYANVNDGDLKVYVAPKTILEAVTDGNYADLEKKIVFNFAKENIYQRGDLYYANAVLTNLDAENNANITSSQYDLEFAAVAVLDGEATDVVTATQYDVLQKAVISPADEDNAFANAILDAENSPYKNWFGTEEYPIVIDTAEKYADFASKGVETDAVFKVYNKFDFDKADFSANSIYVNFVNFYNGSTLLDTAEVVEGQNAVYGGATPEKAGYRISTHDAGVGGSGIFYNEFDKWVTENNGEVDADLSAVADNMNVYASFKEVDKSNEMLAAASLADPSVACFWDEMFGFKQLNANPTGSGESIYISQCRSYSNVIKYGNETGSTSYVRVGQNNKGLYLGFTLAPHFDREAAAGKYIVFHAYLETLGDTDAYGQVRLNGGTKTVRVDTGCWSTVVFPADTFISSTYISIYAWNCDYEQDVKYYFSRAYVVDASEVVNLTEVASDYTYNVGDTTLVNTVYKWAWGEGWREDLSASLPFALQPHLVEGNLIWHDASGRAAGLQFATPLTGKVYVTARGLGAPYMQVFTSRESGHQSSPGGTVVKELDNGFKVWEFNFGSDSIGYVRFYAKTIAGQQVLVSNISTVNPNA